MSVAIKELAQGTHLAYGDGATPEVFVNVAKIKTDVPFPALTSALVDVTDHDSVGGVMEKILGLSDPGTITFTIHYLVDNASHDHLIALAQSRAIVNWQITMVGSASGHVWTFRGMVDKFAAKAPINGPYEADISIAISGKPTPPVIA